MTRSIAPANVSGTVRAPASKSSMQRAVACAALADGESTIGSPSLCDDSRAALGVARAIGARVEIGEDSVRVHGLAAPLRSSTADLELDCGESGLCMRMFAPIAALRAGKTRMSARGSLVSRDVGMVASPLEALGARCADSKGLPPLLVEGPLRGGRAIVDARTSSQFLTGLLLALPLAPEDSQLEVRGLASGGYVDLTIATMHAFGVGVERARYGSVMIFRIEGRRRYRTADFPVEGDWSGAAFILAAGAIAAAANPVRVVGLETRSSQPDRAAIDALRDSGAILSVDGNAVTVSRGAPRAFSFDARDRPDLFPPLAALAAYCPGTSEIIGVSRLRGKESDRAGAITEEFGKLGIEVGIEGESMLVRGGRPQGGNVDSRGDHRMAMAAAILALGATGPVSISGSECVTKSWPEFFEVLDHIRSGERGNGP
jgi:3-phosphoshikimate 1-carboxyvinyltransferase